MQFDMKKVADAVDGGLALICASCIRYWEARDKGVPGDACGSRGCGGPPSGGAFADYKGPLSPERFPNWCFVCGADPDHTISLFGSNRQFGVCSDHLRLLDPANLGVCGENAASTENQVFIRVNGLEVPIRRIFDRPRKQTLTEAILEVETYYAEKEGREL